MAASPFDGSRRVVVILAGSTDDPAVREQRTALLARAGDLDERHMAVFVALPDGAVDPVHGPAPTSGDVRAFLTRNPWPKGSSPGRFAVLLVGKDGGVKLRSDRPVRPEDLFDLIDTMPMRRQEMKR